MEDEFKKFKANVVESKAWHVIDNDIGKGNVGIRIEASKKQYKTISNMIDDLLKNTTVEKIKHHIEEVYDKPGFFKTKEQEDKMPFTILKMMKNLEVSYENQNLEITIDYNKEEDQNAVLTITFFSDLVYKKLKGTLIGSPYVGKAEILPNGLKSAKR
ncbi:MAG: hypothetical protein ACP5RT_02005 [Candidatus Micrarchaeia archaeon]